MAVSEFSARHLPWPACYNVRELGGYPIAGGGQVRWRALLRGDNLCRLTPQGCTALVDYGVRTIIDLRSPSELALAPHPFHEQGQNPHRPLYLNLPLLDAADGPGMAALNALSSVQQAYEFILERYAGQIGAVLRGIAAAAPGGVLVHCHAGKDRTGLIIALVLALAGVPEGIIAEDYAASDLYLQALYEQMLVEVSDDPVRKERLARELVSHPETLLGALRFLNTRYGGARPYLELAGLTEQDIHQIQSRISP
jgi:protein-tyrosine phosphatase